MSETLRYSIEREAAYPSRPALRRRLGAIEKTAQLLMDELADPQILAWLLDEDKAIENHNEMYHGLRDMAGRAKRAHARIARKRQGRGKLYPDKASGPNPKEHCALIVAVAFHQEHGKWPGKNDVKVHKFCEVLWEAGWRP